jgi:hypothetical protein
VIVSERFDRSLFLFLNIREERGELKAKSGGLERRHKNGGEIGIVQQRSGALERGMVWKDRVSIGNDSILAGRQ